MLLGKKGGPFLRPPGSDSLSGIFFFDPPSSRNQFFEALLSIGNKSYQWYSEASTEYLTSHFAVTLTNQRIPP